MADSWVKAVKNKADISPGKLTDYVSSRRSTNPYSPTSRKRSGWT
jgi:hypothetical protein